MSSLTSESEARRADVLPLETTSVTSSARARTRSGTPSARSESVARLRTTSPAGPLGKRSSSSTERACAA